MDDVEVVELCILNRAVFRFPFTESAATATGHQSH